MVPGHIYADKVGNLEVLYGLDEVVSATAEVQASLNYSMIIDGIPWRLGAAYGAVTSSRHASDRAYVLSTGSVVLEGRAQHLLEDEAVRKAYLG